MTPIFFDTAARRLFSNPRVATQRRTRVACPCYVPLGAGNTFAQSAVQVARQHRDVVSKEWDFSSQN
jgi:hypothetical protein